MNKIKMWLPPEGTLDPNDEEHDPLPYYYRPITGYLYRKRIESGLSLLRPPYRRILEIGYGSGIALPTLSRMGDELWGIDTHSVPDCVADRLGRISVHARLAQGDCRTWRHGGDPFDLVVAFSVLEHIAAPAMALSQIASLLRPNGTLLIGMPRVDKAMAALFPLIGYRGIERHHVTTFHEVGKCAQPHFVLDTVRVFPTWCPQWAGLYFNMLFFKRPNQGYRAEQGASADAAEPRR
ncbi:MAG: class I SAM-dependent methyltransferase [Planctomycetia bacterium]|nr:class I SAM-dependent methyltransferase [Planctomycetia bacterium]